MLILKIFGICLLLGASISAISIVGFLWFIMGVENG